MPQRKSTKRKKESKGQLNDSLKKQDEITPITFQYIGSLQKTTTIVGIVQNRVPFTVSDKIQIHHFRNLNTFEELPKGYKVEKDGMDYEIPDDVSTLETMKASEVLGKDWEDDKGYEELQGKDKK
ncbi:MAG: hypothetical protein ACFE95_02730 [Candidatus Hodarchaeota archaeon]